MAEYPSGGRPAPKEWLTVGGVCVHVAFDGRRTAVEDVAAMVGIAPHRGPDGTRTWSGQGAALAHQRLLVLPEDVEDQQPLVRDGLVLVADARIDNREELVPPLLRSGLLLGLDQLPPDSEVVLAAYRLWGSDCAARLVGDFAFVVWDIRRRTVFAARDPMGMRALYYRWEPRRRLLLATEAKQVLAAGGVPREVNELAVAATLAGPIMPSSWTLFSGLDQLPAGHVLEASETGCRTRSSWRPDPTVRFRPTEHAAAAEAFREVLGEAVRARLRSVRPVGIWLSGGLDSGSIASHAGRLRESGAITPATALHTYSWAFTELADADERAVSNHIVERYGLGATAVPADDSWPLAGYPLHGPDEDDPFCWPYQALIERTVDRCRAEGMGLLLSGDRGDEVTGDWAFDEWGMLRAGRFRAAAADVGLAGPSLWSGVRRALVGPLTRAVSPGLIARRAASVPVSWPSWIPDDFARRTGLPDLVVESRRPSSFGGPARSVRYGRVFSAQAVRTAVLYERTRSRRAMGYADPYTDRRVLELVLSMPQWLVQRRSEPKALARRAALGVMPEQARTSASKIIPASLHDRGLRDRALPIVDDLLTGSQAAARGWLDEAAAQRVHQRTLRTGEYRTDLWWPLCVEMWLRRWWR